MATGAIVNVIVEGRGETLVRETVEAVRAQLRALLDGTSVIVNVVARVKADESTNGSER